MILLWAGGVGCAGGGRGIGELGGDRAAGAGSLGPAPAGVAEAVEGMMRALGLGAKMDAERLSLTARRYADLMAASLSLIHI